MRVLAATALLWLAAGAAQAANPNPSFSVSVSAVYVRHHITHLVPKPDSQGCSLSTNADATQLIRMQTQSPVVLTYRQLLHGVSPFQLLLAEETRGGSYVYGYNTGCPKLQSTPLMIDPTSGCGKVRSFKVLPIFDAVGFVNKTHRFRFSTQFAGADAYNGSCVPSVFVNESDQIPNAEIFTIPPAAWGTTTAWWTTVDPAKLLAGKPVVVTYKHSATIVAPHPTGDPTAYDQALVSDAFTVSWTVTLTPHR